jgi:hypothetical protein
MTYNKTPSDGFIEGSEIFEGDVEGFSPHRERRGPQTGDGILYFMLDFAARHQNQDVAAGTRDFLTAAKSLFRNAGVRERRS